MNNLEGACPGKKFARWLIPYCFVLLTSLAPAGTPIEIWLSKGTGRYGDIQFQALGGRKTHPTPKGTFYVKSMYRDFYSRKYKAPMPLSIFFTGQCAIHVGSLRQKSHGCIHIDRKTAEYLYQRARPGRTRVIIHP